MTTTLLKSIDPPRLQGATLWGRRAQVELFSHEKRGFHWLVDGQAVPLEKSLATTKRRWIELHCRQHKLSIAEHFLALRWTGLSCLIETQALPYFATANEVWEKVRNSHHLEDSFSEIEWVRPKEEIVCHYLSDRNRWVTVSPLKEDALELEITIDFKGIGHHAEHYRFPDMTLLESVFTSRPLAWPPWSRFVIDGLSFFGWPHSNKFLWPHQINPDNQRVSLKEICDHRAVDILGALALVHPTGLPAVRYTSRCAGHAGDLRAINMTSWS